MPYLTILFELSSKYLNERVITSKSSSPQISVIQSTTDGLQKKEIAFLNLFCVDMHLYVRPLRKFKSCDRV